MNRSTWKLAAVATVIGLGVSLGACKKKDENPVEKASEAVQDGLNMRDNEKLKDAGENIQDAAKDTSEAVKDKAEDIKN